MSSPRTAALVARPWPQTWPSTTMLRRAVLQAQAGWRPQGTTHPAKSGPQPLPHPPTTLDPELGSRGWADNTAPQVQVLQPALAAPAIILLGGPLMTTMARTRSFLQAQAELEHGPQQSPVSACRGTFPIHRHLCSTPMSGPAHNGGQVLLPPQSVGSLTSKPDLASSGHSR